MDSEQPKRSKRQFFMRAFGRSTGKSLGRLFFWLPVIYYGRPIWIHLIDVIGAHVK